MIAGMIKARVIDAGFMRWLTMPAGVPSSRFLGAEPFPVQVADNFSITGPIGIGPAAGGTVGADAARA
jgi:hypothetical protein